MYGLAKIQGVWLEVSDCMCTWIIQETCYRRSISTILLNVKITLRPLHTRDFAPGSCSRGKLREQSSSVCTNDSMGILHPREQNFHPAKCSTIFNRLNIWEQAPGANWANLKTLPRVYWHVQNPGEGGYSHTLPIRVCAAQRGRDFEAPDLQRGIHFRGVF